MHLRDGYRSVLFLIAAATAVSCADDPTPPALSTGSAGASTSSSTAGTTSSTSSGTTGTTVTGTATTSGTSGTGGASTATGAGGSSAGAGGVATGAGGAGGTDIGAGGAIGTGGAGGTPLPPYQPGDTPSPLPFVVDSAFIASGYMGDGATPNSIVEDATSCNATRPANAQGKCHKYTYTPVTAVGGAGWGGVYWQYPVNNWGTTPGKRIAPGATKITFSAAGAVGGEAVTFIAGLRGANYLDTINGSTMVTLTTTMTPYTIDLTGQMYDAVLGAFGWTIAKPASSGADAGADAGAPGITFTVDNIQWQQ